jgi:hypothetical protein
MDIIGVNIDPLNPAGAPEPGALKAIGFNWVRLVSRPGVEPYIQKCQAADIKVLAVIAGDSMQDGKLFKLDPPPDVYQVGNEPDGDGVSSWKMDQDAYTQLWNTYAAELDAPVIAAGLCSGDPTGWLGDLVSNLQPPPRALAVHPYGATADDASALFDAFAQFSLPLWLTEWNLLPRDWSDQETETDLTAVWEVFNSRAEAAFWFCWSDGMVSGLGLLDAQGEPKPSYADLAQSMATASLG